MLNMWHIIAVLAVNLGNARAIAYPQDSGRGLQSPLLTSLSNDHSIIDSWCPLPTPSQSPSDGLKASHRFADEDFRKRQIVRLTAAVNVPTETFQNSGEVGSDPRFKTFQQLHDLLRKQFPLVFVMLPSVLQ